MSRCAPPESPIAPTAEAKIAGPIPMIRQVFLRVRLIVVLAAASTGCSGPSSERPGDATIRQPEGAKAGQPESAKLRPTERSKIRQILNDVVAPHYYDGEWDLSPDAATLALPHRGASSTPPGFPRPPGSPGPPVKHGVELWDLTSAKSTMLPESPDDLRGSLSVAFSKSGRARSSAQTRHYDLRTSGATAIVADS